MRKPPEPKTARRFPLGPRPARALGQSVRAIRQARNLSQGEVAAKIDTHLTQVSLVERGANVEVQWYERIAHALGFRNAFEMFAAGGDDLTPRMLRLWKRLPDDAARRDVLKVMKRLIVDDVERDAT